MLRRHWGSVLTACMAFFGLGWLIMGIAPVYPKLTDWDGYRSSRGFHVAFAGHCALSPRFSHHRASALSLHGVGGT
ncbi:MAG: hypothetical protein Ct9H300mP11_05740 [Chloroflexota bacterium]|nr:MAG: hypothetical protein Ct9H300mP11_05740 [Chloroflexota bacterium]